MQKFQSLTVPSAISVRGPREWSLDLPPTHPAHVRNRPITPASLTTSSEDSAEEHLLLTNESGLKCVDPPWALVEQTIRELDSGRGNSFCVLGLPNNTYVQCLHGFNGWHLEWRLSGSSLDRYIHLRGADANGSRKPFELKKSDYVSPGQHGDLLQLEDVLDAFQAFHQGEGPTSSLAWRRLDV